MTIWSSIALFHPNCPFYECQFHSGEHRDWGRKEDWMKLGWGPRAKESWHSSNFSRQMYKNTVVQDFVQEMNSRMLPGFHLALLVLLKRRLSPQHCNQGPWLLILAAEEVQINNHQCLVLGRCVGQRGIQPSLQLLSLSLPLLHLIEGVILFCPFSLEACELCVSIRVEMCLYVPCTQVYTAVMSQRQECLLHSLFNAGLLRLGYASLSV